LSDNFFFALSIRFSVSAENPIVNGGFGSDATFFRISGVLKGLKVGAPICGGTGTVWGLETSVFASGTDHVNGIQCSILVDLSKKITGLQASIVNYCEDVKGMQFGVFNMAKNRAFQLGVINYIENSSIPIMPVINVRF